MYVVGKVLPDNLLLSSDHFLFSLHWRASASVGMPPFFRPCSLTMIMWRKNTQCPTYQYAYHIFSNQRKTNQLSLVFFSGFVNLQWIQLESSIKKCPAFTCSIKMPDTSKRHQLYKAWNMLGKTFFEWFFSKCTILLEGKRSTQHVRLIWII